MTAPRGHGPGRGGLVSVELMALLLVMLAFLSGTVLLIDDAVRSGEGAAGRAALGTEAGRVLDFIEGAVSDARAVGTGTRWGEAPAAEPGSVLEMLVDIDGDAHTGSYSVDGISGLERVLLYRPSGQDKRLLALVFDRRPDEAPPGGDTGPRKSVITDELDRRYPGAFKVSFAGVGGDAPRSVSVSLGLSNGPESMSATRVIRYRGRPPE